ncbi:MAG: hypothetical protein AAF696_36550 [Bacteroidota bacterium]
MKTSLLFISTLLLAQLSFGQSYQVELQDLPRTAGESLTWEGNTQSPEFTFLSTDNGFWGATKKGRIFIAGDHIYSVKRKGDRFFLYDTNKSTQLVKHTTAYLTLDGTALKRKRNMTGDKISIIHPDGRILAEGKIKSKVLGKHTMTLDIKGKSPYSEEILAMLSIDLLETLKDRFEWTPTFTASRN